MCQSGVGVLVAVTTRGQGALQRRHCHPAQHSGCSIAETLIVYLADLTEDEKAHSSPFLTLLLCKSVSAISECVNSRVPEIRLKPARLSEKSLRFQE